jgi:hypothetical protein
MGNIDYHCVKFTHFHKTNFFNKNGVMMCKAV